MRFFGVLFFLILAISSESLAASNGKIGTVDLQRAVSESSEGVKARADLLKKKDRMTEELKSSLAELETIRTEMEKNKLSVEERAEKERVLQRKARDYQNRQREAQEELKQVESDSLRKLIARFDVILKKMGEEENYAVILDKSSGVFYAGSQTDVTAQLVKKADQEYRKK